MKQESWTRTRSMTLAEEQLRLADGHRATATQTKKKRIQRVVTHTTVEVMEPGDFALMILRVLLVILAPLVTDLILERPVVEELLYKNFRLTGDFLATICTAAAVIGQANLVLILSAIGSARRGATGKLVKVVGLLTAISIPLMTLSVNRAHQAIADSESTFIDSSYLLALAFFSLAVHVAIWVEAPKILHAMEDLVVIVRNFYDEKKEARELRAADESEQHARQYVARILSEGEQVENRYDASITFLHDSHDERISKLWEEERTRKAEAKASRNGTNKNDKSN
jgi:hypothetical protein